MSSLKLKWTLQVNTCTCIKVLFCNIFIFDTEKDIEKFLRSYRGEFSHSSVIPKMHILEHHVVPWMRRWSIGAGLMGEQGAESVHSHFNRLQQTYCGIPDPLDRLTYVFREHTLETCPPLTALQPPPKKRRVSQLPTQTNFGHKSVQTQLQLYTITYI